MIKNILFHADDFGRSSNISKTIYKCIKAKTINSISIIVSDKIYGLNYLKKIKVNKRLHLNLTDFNPKKAKKSFLYNQSFLKLLFWPFLPNFNKKKKLIENEIKRQIRIYKKTFKEKKIFIDGHQHVHMIPWIFNILIKNSNNFGINNIRIPDEKFLINIEDLFKLSILNNIFKFFILKFFIFYSIKKIKKIKYNFIFFGIIYSGHQNIKYIQKVINIQKYLTKRKKIELLFHPGFSLRGEKALFKKKFYNYYSSNFRTKEFYLTYNLKKIIK